LDLDCSAALPCLLQGVYSPSKLDGAQVVFHEDRVMLPPDMWSELNTTVNIQAGIIKNLTNKENSSATECWVLNCNLQFTVSTF
jgi:hypothetical protein